MEKSKKEFYEKYIQSEDEKMMQIIHENARKHPDDKMYCRKANRGISVVYGLLVAMFGIVGWLIGVLWTR